MAILRIGRWGEDIEIGRVARWEDQSRGAQNQRVRIRGHIRVASLANLQTLRTELLEHVGAIVAVTWTLDSTRDGFYQMLSADIGDLFLPGVGYASYRVDLERIGSEALTEFQSLIAGTVLTNDHGIIESETQPFHAAPVGVVSYDSGAGTPTAMTRTTEDGAIYVFRSIDFTGDPSWSVAPSSYYAGAAEISVTSQIRTGLDAPNDVADFSLTNGLIRVTPDLTASVSNGRLNVETYDGSVWDTKVKYGVYFNATTVIPEWHTIGIVRNTPEVTTIRLVRDADEAPPTSARHILDIRLRRGSRFLECYYSYTGGTHNIQVRRETNEAATAVTPTGASGAVGIRATSNDGSSNRFVLATPHTHVQDLTNGRIYRAASTTMSFMIGAEVGGSAAVAGDVAADLMLQFLGHINETVRGVLR